MPYIIVGLVAVALLMSTQNRGANLFNPRKAPPAAPGPGAQTLWQQLTHQAYPRGFSPQGSGVTQGSPNSTLSTINGSVVIANNALGFLQQLDDYTNSYASDTEYQPPAPQLYSSGVSPDQLDYSNLGSLEVDPSAVYVSSGDSSYLGI